MKVEIISHGDVQLSRELVRFAHRLEDASPAFEQIADDLRGWERRQFDTDGRYASGGFAPLAASTVASKLASDDARTRANARRPLRATEETMRSLINRRAPGALEVIQPHQMVFGSTVEQARYHQPDAKGRRFLEIRESDRRAIVKRVQRFMVGTLDGAAERGLT